MDNLGFMKVAAATPMVAVGDCMENAQRIVSLAEEAARRGVEVVVYPELSLTGYTLGDLIMYPTLLRSTEQALEVLIKASRKLPLALIVGAPLKRASKLYNCGVVIAQGKICGVVPKQIIPDYDGMTQNRWFESGREIHAQTITVCEQEVPFGSYLKFAINDVEVGVELSSDLFAPHPHSTDLSLAGAKVIFNLAAQSAEAGRYPYIRHTIQQISAATHSAYVYASSAHGESTTNAVYAGEALIAENGKILKEGKRFALCEQLLVSDVDIERLGFERQRNTAFRDQASTVDVATVRLELPLSPVAAAMDRTINPMPFIPQDESERKTRCQELFQIQAHGLIQRLQHTHARSAIIGISGGLDSTLALLVAVEAFDLMRMDRKMIIGVTMPGFGTTGRTYDNALKLMRGLGISIREVSIKKACLQHFEDIGLDPEDRSAAYENGQARERTQILMDLANKEGGLVIGTGDLSELALGWATYNGDQMSMYGVNATIPKTLVRYLVRWIAERMEDQDTRDTLLDVIDTPVSPELLPADNEGHIAQKTEDLVGPYELHDFFIYAFLRCGYSPRKILYLAKEAFHSTYDHATILHWLKTFFRRFFSQQFKRSAMPDGAKTGSISLSPRGDWAMPSDALSAAWLDELEHL